MPESKIKKLLVPAGLAVGGITIGAFFAPIGIASAQTEDDSETTDSTEADVDAETGAEDEGTHRRGGRHGKRAHFGGDVLTETLGLSAEELRDAMAENQSLADVATEQGVTVEALTQALTDAANERIDEALAEEKIDEDRAADLKADVAERVEAMITTTPEEARASRTERREEFKGQRQDRRAEMTATLEEALGLPADEILESLQSGSTLGDLAAEQGVSEDDLADALVADAMARVDEALAEGQIDEDRAEEMTEGIEARIDDLIENGRPERGERPQRGEGRRGGAGAHGRFGPRGGGDVQPEAPTDGETVESSFNA